MIVLIFLYENLRQLRCRGFTISHHWIKFCWNCLTRFLRIGQQLVMFILNYLFLLEIVNGPDANMQLRNISWICDRLKSQPSVSSNQAIIEGERRCIYYAGLRIAASSCFAECWLVPFADNYFLLRSHPHFTNLVSIKKI